MTDPVRLHMLRIILSPPIKSDSETKKIIVELYCRCTLNFAETEYLFAKLKLRSL